MKGNSARIRRSGGGVGSRINKSVGVRNGASATGVRPAGVSQFGSAVGNKSTGGPMTGYRGEKYATATPAGGRERLGNAVAASTVCGPGGSRSVMRSGSQTGTAVTPQPIGPTKDTLAEYGPDSAGVRNRR